MRLVAVTKEDVSVLSLLQRQVTQLFKAEKGSGSKLESVYKEFINTPIEKAYERAGDAVRNAAITNMDTDDKALIMPYIVHAAVNRKRIAVQYRDSKGNVSKRVLEPFNFKGNNLVAYCHERGAWRSFVPSNIIRVAITEDDFIREEDVEITAEDAKRPLF